MILGLLERLYLFRVLYYEFTLSEDLPCKLFFMAIVINYFIFEWQGYSELLLDCVFLFGFFSCIDEKV